MATDDKAEAAYLADLEGQVATLTARFVDQEAKLGLSLKKRTRQRDALIRREQDLAKLLSSKDKEIKLLKNQQKAVASELGGENEHLLAQASDYASTLVAAEVTITNLKNELGDAEVSIGELQAELTGAWEEAMLNVTRARQEVREELQTSVDHVQKALGQASTDQNVVIEMGERRINALKEDIDFLQDELAEASEAKDLADCAVEEAAAELGRLTSDVGTLTERLASANDECAALRSDLKKRDAEAHAVAAKLGKAQGKEEAIKLSAAIDAADARVATAEAEAETSKKEGAAAREKLAASDSENRALTTKLDAAAAAAAESLAAVQGGHDDRVAELEATVAQMAAAETELRNEIADVRDSITSRRANGRGGSGGASSGARRSAAPRTKGKAAAKPVPAGGSGAEKRKSVRPPAHWAGEEGDSDDEAFVRGPGLKKGTSLVMIDSLEAMIGDLTDTADRMAKVGDDSDDEELLVGDEFMKQFLEDAANEVKEEKLKAAKSEKVPSSSSKAKKGKKGSALSTQQIARIEKAKQAIEKQTSDQSDSVADTIAQMRGALGKLRKMPSFVSEEKMRVVAEGKGRDPLKAVPTAEEKKAGKKAELKKVVAKKKAKKKADKERKKSGGLSSSSAAPKSGGVKRERPKSSSSNASTDSQKSKRSETKRTKTPPKQRKPAAAAAGSSKAKPAGAAAGVRGKTPPARPRASPSKKAPTTKAAVRSKSPPRPRKM